MEEFLKNLDINKSGTLSDDGCYVIDLDDREFGKYYSILDKSDKVEEDIDTSMVTEDNCSIQYNNDEYNITLMDDGENYKLVCKKIK